jgi:hypothetical protein
MNQFSLGVVARSGSVLTDISKSAGDHPKLFLHFKDFALTVCLPDPAKL